MAGFTPSLHPRDAYGRFKGKRVAKKIKRLRATNKRVAGQLISDRKRRGVSESAALDPFEAAVYRRVVRREAQIVGLQKKVMQGKKVTR